MAKLYLPSTKLFYPLFRKFFIYVYVRRDSQNCYKNCNNLQIKIREVVLYKLKYTRDSQKLFSAIIFTCHTTNICCCCCTCYHYYCYYYFCLCSTTSADSTQRERTFACEFTKNLFSQVENEFAYKQSK